MSRIYFVLIFTLVSGSIVAQNTSIVQIINNNFLYRELDNRVVAGVTGFECSEIQVEIDNGEIIGDSCSYFIRPGKKVGLKVKIYVINDSDTIFYQDTYFRVKNIPDPLVKAAGKINGELIRKSDLVNCFGLRATNVSFGPYTSWMVESFSFTRIEPSGDGITVNVIGNRFDDPVKRMIKLCNPGDEIIFSNIIANEESGARREIQDLTLKIK